MSEGYTEHERAAAGMDHDDSIREKVSDFGSRLAAEGPEALLEQVEQLVPDPVKAQVREFPLLAVAIGVGAGVFLGMKKSNEVIAAASSLIAAAATANLNTVLSGMRGEGEEE